MNDRGQADVRGRRTFLRALAGASGATAALGATQTTGAEPKVHQASQTSQPPATRSGADDRAYWLDVSSRLATPVLTALAERRLRATMPVEAAEGAAADRREVTHLEALGRTLAGIAPWLELTGGPDDEARRRASLLEAARRAIDSAVDPASPDALNFTKGGQPLVDAAFLAHAFVRAPRALWQGLPSSTRQRVVAALQSTRSIQPPFNNWLLFQAMVETALFTMGAAWDRVRIDYAVRQHEQWYKGDGLYGDGPLFHWDYYNSYVIQPMLLDVLKIVGDTSAAWRALIPAVTARAKRYAAIQERLIAPDGSFPAIGRSLAYRCGAFQLLAQLALHDALPEGIAPAQARCALSAVIHRTMDAPGTFDAQGWLTIGLCGHQPGIGERYISTGSLYLCSVALLPLGLGPASPFWSAPPQEWTSRRAWGGLPMTTDHALD